MTPSRSHLEPVPPPQGPMIMVTLAFGVMAAVVAMAVGHGRMSAEEILVIGVSCAQIGAALLVLAARGKAARMLPWPHRLAYVGATGLLIATGLFGLAQQIVPSIRAIPHNPQEFVMWVQYLGFSLGCIHVAFYLCWCSREGHSIEPSESRKTA